MSCLKEYIAILTRSGANAPIARVLLNTFDGPIVWTRDAEAIYRGTLEAAFIKKKTHLLVSASSDDNAGTAATLICTSENEVMLLCTEDGISTISVHIRLYP